MGNLPSESPPTSSNPTPPSNSVDDSVDLIFSAMPAMFTGWMAQQGTSDESGAWAVACENLSVEVVNRALKRVAQQWDGSFAPTPGQFRAMCLSIKRSMEYEAKQRQEALAPPPKDVKLVWQECCWHLTKRVMRKFKLPGLFMPDQPQSPHVFDFNRVVYAVKIDTSLSVLDAHRKAQRSAKKLFMELWNERR